MDQVQTQLENLKVNLDKQPLLQKLEDESGVPKLYIVGATGFLCLLFVVTGFGAGILTNLVGFVYPAYASMAAIESSTKTDDVQWLTYWVVYAFFMVFEVFIDGVLYCIPFYYAFKLGFIAWLFAPSTRGATFVYHHLLEPFLSQHETRIDTAISKARENSAGVIADATAIAAKVGSEAARAAAHHIVDSKIDNKQD